MLLLLVNQMLHVLLPPYNSRNYFEHMLYVHTLYWQHWDPILAAVSISNMYVLHDLNNSDPYTSCSMYEQDSVVARHERTNYMCTIACVLQHRKRDMCTLLTCNLWVSCTISWVTLIAHACNCHISTELYHRYPWAMVHVLYYICHVQPYAL